MSGISSIPPLLCNTPPPMDFGDEEEDGDSVLPNDISLDDEEVGAYNAFIVSQPHADGTNSNVPPLIESPVHVNSTNLLTTGNLNLLNIENDSPVKKSAKPIEAFNLAISSAILGSNSPPPIEFNYATNTTYDHRYDANEEDEEEFQDIPAIDCDSRSEKEISNEKEEEGEDFDSQKNEDNISLPSLKFDTLSINSDNLSGCSPTPPSHFHDRSAEESENKEQCEQKSKDYDSRSSPCSFSQLPEDLVKLEDILDDSSDEETRSPKRKNNININENTVDFFAIHTVDHSKPNPDNTKINMSECINTQKTIATTTSNENNIIADTTSRIVDLDKNVLSDDDDFDSFTDFTDFQTPAMDTAAQLSSAIVYQEAPQQAQSLEFDADFGDFVTTTADDDVKEAELKLEKPNSNVQRSDSLDEDDFEDFQDFTATSCVQLTESTKIEQPEHVSHAVDTDDDFGEFTDVAYTVTSEATAEPPVYISISSTVNKQNLNGKLNSILNMMFPSEILDPTENLEKAKLQFGEKSGEVCLKLGSIDVAKALDYHWTKSEVRHSLIRSLGIDSRNILYGEKWNSSMPRYGASLKPLEPLKPQQVSQHGSTTNDATHSNYKDRSIKTLKPDVPAVEFDWNSSGLINPLDGPQEDLHKREIEKIHSSQLGPVDEPFDQQSSHSAFAANDSDGKLADNFNNNNATSATPTAFNTTATATLSSNVSTDSISHNINDIGYHADIGISNPSTSLSSIVGANSKTKVATIQQQQSTTTDLSYNLATTLSNNKAMSEIIDDEVVATSTFAGPLKETHIYTPSKIDAAVASKSGAVTSNKSTVPIDFDYEIAAAGIIIDETVVKKEYRDIEYNPGFSLDSMKPQSIDLMTNSDKATINDDFFGPLQNEPFQSEEYNKLANKNNFKPTSAIDEAEIDDEFTDFQSVPPSNSILVQNCPVQSFIKSSEAAAAVVPRTKDLVSGDKASRTSTPTFGGREMILSPAILLPQAISIESSKPKIEWGEAVASINPEELARIEELFPQPKTDAANLNKASTISNGYQNQESNKSLSISAAIAKKELQVDDDDWSEFVSVPAAPEIFGQHKLPVQVHLQNNASNNNNQLTINTQRQQQRSQTNLNSAQVPKKMDKTASSIEEEWSDFVSSAPPPHAMSYKTMPQFNSAAWKNANFYNNPLSFYQSQTQTQTQIHSNLVPKFHHHNNNSEANLSYNNNYSKYNQLHQQKQQQLQQHQFQQNQYAQQLQLQQQIHVMQDFSTAPPSPHRLTNAAPVPNYHATNTPFQVGSAKVAPSISLIPDLGFIAPAATTHTAFINTLPKPSLITKK